MEIGADITEEDLKIFETFSERTWHISSYASERGCHLYVDAEQTYLQDSLESWAQQLTQHFNRGNKAIIMNGYQCYLKRMT